MMRAAASPPSAVLAGVGGWVPPRAVTNEELAAGLGTTDTWIRNRTGIACRYRVADGQGTSDLAVQASLRALEHGGVTDVDAVLVATTTPDRPCPATAPVVAARLGLRGVAAFDVGAVCAGFVYGLAAATGLIAAGAARTVLLVGADTYSSIVHPEDRDNAVVFGDGAGAVLLRAGDADDPGSLGHFDLGSDGSGEDLITVRDGGSKRPREAERLPEDGYFTMSGKEVFRRAVTHLTDSARRTLTAAGRTVEEVDHFVPHQANARILRAVADDLGLDGKRVVVHLDEVGNTGAASVPLALAAASADGVLTPGSRVLLSAFGGGLTWGSALLTWPDLAPAEPPHTTFRDEREDVR